MHTGHVHGGSADLVGLSYHSPFGELLSRALMLDGSNRPSVAREVLEYFSPAAVSELLSAPDTRFIVAERVEHMIGFAQLTLGSIHELTPTGPAAELKRLYVHKRFAGSRVGTALLREVEALAAEEGAITLWLTVWAGNHRALAFYARRGYKDLSAASYVFESEQYETRVFAKALDSKNAT